VIVFNVIPIGFMLLRNIPQKAQISKFKTKESEHTHHFKLVGLAVIEYFITLGDDLSLYLLS
jgi:hypothetical protein